MSKEREELYAQVTNGVDPTEEKVKEETVSEKTSAEKEVTSEVTEEVKTLDEVKTTEETKDEEKEEVIEEDKTKTEKGDLKSALKEERVKRRQLKSEYETKIAEKEKQLSEVLQYIKTSVTPEEKTDVIEDYDTEIRKLQQKIKELDAWKSSTSVKSQEEDRQRLYKDLMTRIEKTDTLLKEEGYPGFAKFKTLITEELNNMPDEERTEMDNEKGWVEIYKTTVFPSVKNVFTSVSREEKTAQKVEAKKGAAMLGETKGEVKIKKDEDWSYEDYLKMRREKSGG